MRDAGNGLLVSGINQAQLGPRPLSQPVMCPNTWGGILTILPFTMYLLFATHKVTNVILILSFCQR